MMDVSETVRHLADQLGVTVDWATFHAHASAPPVLRFVMLAAQAAFATSVHQVHDEHIGAALDAAAVAGGTTDTDVAALLHAISIDQSSRRDEAIDHARTLLGELLRLGVVR